MKKENWIFMPHAGTFTALDFNGYNDAKDAYDGHMKLCKKWSKE